MCGVVGGAWNPGDLAGLAATLLPAESRSRGLLWQNTAKTVPATADGDPVRVAVCPYTAVEFTAPSDAARPLLWDEGGGKWSLFHDGVDDGLAMPSNIALTNFEVWISGFRPTGSCILLVGPTGTAFPQFLINSTANRLSAINDSVSSAATSSVFPVVCPASMSIGYSQTGSTISYFQNSSAIGTATLGGTCTVRRLGLAGEFGVAFTGRASGLVICTAAQSAGTRAELVTYLGTI